MNKTLVILAAGMGSRFGGLKQMEGIGPHGETLLEFAVFDAIWAGFNDVVFVIRSSFEEAFKEKLTARFDTKIQVRFAFQDSSDLPEGFTCPAGRTKPWGTGHALLSARKLLTNPFAVINADDFYGRLAFVELAQFMDQLETNSKKGCLVGYPVQKTLSPYGPVSRGFIGCENGSKKLLKSIQEYEGIQSIDGLIEARSKSGETRKLENNDLVSVNCFGFSASVIPLFESSFKSFLSNLTDPEKEEFYLPSATTEMVSSGEVEVEVLSADASWMGVTYKEDQPEVEERIKEFIQSGEYPSPLWG